MFENLTTAFIVLGGLVGIALGLYGLAPALFPRRLGKAREALYGWEPDYEDPEEQPLPDFSAMDNYRAPAGETFVLPSAWRGTAEEGLAAEPTLAPVFAAIAEEAEGAEPFVPLPEIIPPFAAPEARNDAAPELDEVLDIFREVYPDARPTPGRRALSTTGEKPVSIAELLADARWTAMALTVAKSGALVR